jgi:hypothetical protein
MSSKLPFDESPPFQSGQRLQCPQCGSEIVIIFETPVREPNQVFRCCGGDMVPVHGNPPPG